MRYLIYVIFIICLCGLTAGLSPVVSILGQAPNLLLLAVLVWSLDKMEEDFLLLAFIAGLFLDIYSGSVIGSFTLPFLAAGLLIRLLAENFLLLDRGYRNLPMLVLPFFAFFYIFYFLFNLVLRGAGATAIGWNAGYFLKTFFFACCYNLLFAYPVYWAVGLVKLFLRNYVEKEYKAG